MNPSFQRDGVTHAFSYSPDSPDPSSMCWTIYLFEPLSSLSYIQLLAVESSKNYALA